jgi:hypothetical protein
MTTTTTTRQEQAAADVRKCEARIRALRVTLADLDGLPRVADQVREEIAGWELQAESSRGIQQRPWG